MPGTLISIFRKIYPGAGLRLLEVFIKELELNRQQSSVQGDTDKLWYKNAVVYSLYIDLFNRDINGLESKLGYLAELGINCLWILPILDSPMKDAGFDVRDYRRIRPELLGMQDNASNEELAQRFRQFVKSAHDKGIRLIFDIALNHTSDEHPWFAIPGENMGNPRRKEFYIWNRDESLYSGARIIFKGLCRSNWEKSGEEYYFHRFFPFQPDLNYRNPEVLLEMARNLLYWQSIGIDGFRADAIPYLWKEDGSSCENLPETHLVVKFFRAALDYVKPGTILLAEANQLPQDVVKYFGNGKDECHAGYHFPLMPQLFKAFATAGGMPVKGVLSPQHTPPIGNENQWFTFLRLHDELTLEMVNDEDRELLYNYYCRKPWWDFRMGEGISARLADLLDNDPQRIALAFSVLLTLPGTPVIYYGDETGKRNDRSYYHEIYNKTGLNDSRYYVRGRLDWPLIENGLENKASGVSFIYTTLKRMLDIRRQFPVFGDGSLEWTRLSADNSILSYTREKDGLKIQVIQNLSSEPVHFNGKGLPERDLLGQIIMRHEQDLCEILVYGFYWIKL